MGSQITVSDDKLRAIKEALRRTEERRRAATVPRATADAATEVAKLG